MLPLSIVKSSMVLLCAWLFLGDNSPPPAFAFGFATIQNVGDAFSTEIRR